MKPTYLVHSDLYANWILRPNHPTQGRRFTKAHDLLLAEGARHGMQLKVVPSRAVTRQELSRIHDETYLEEVLVDNECGEWVGPRPDLAEIASLFVGGTLTALDLLLTERTKTAIHFPGAKHHAQYDHSSGFCVFADFALAAEIATRDHGLKVAIFDIDAHHGDGTENLTAKNKDVLTYSVHEWGIFPGTGNENHEDLNIFNLPLGFDGHEELGKGDTALNFAADHFTTETEKFKADLIMIACGADGHLEDPLSSLEYSVAGFVEVARKLRSSFPQTPILLGGAGGYLPDTRTPEVWTQFALNLSQK